MIFLLPSGLYRRLRNYTVSTISGSQALTAGRDLHPAPKILPYSFHLLYYSVQPFVSSEENTSFPSMITHTGLLRISSGFPANSIRSASFPGAMLPTLSSIPQARAALMVTLLSAASSESPSRTARAQPTSRYCYITTG